jgi:hypothetical protein
MTPLVSVVMLSYNHAPYLPAAIESVLGQTFEDLEIVLAEDGSTDGSLDIARRYAEADSRVRVVTHPGHENRGIGATVNLARATTRGRFLLGLPSDDVLYPDTLALEMAFLDAHPRVGYVYGYAHVIDGEGRLLELPGHRGPEPRVFGADLTAGGRIVERLVQGNAIPAMTALWRRQCIDDAGEEHPTLLYGDWEMQARAAAHWEVGFIPRPLALYRVHGKNTSLDVPRPEAVARQLDVTAVLRERAPSVGGRLGEPRVRAALELQMGYLMFAAGQPGADAHLRAAFDRDPALAGDETWLADWLWARPLDELLPDGPRFVDWFAGIVLPLLRPRTARRMGRQVRAARAAARAIGHAQAPRPVAAAFAALPLIANAPARLRDATLRGALLDSIARTSAGNALRIAKRRLLRQAPLAPPRAHRPT